MDTVSVSPRPRHRTLVVDPLPVILRGIQSYLEASPEIEVVGTAQTYEEARPLLHSLHCDVVLLDPALSIRPDESSADVELGLQLIHEIHAQNPRTHVVALAANRSLHTMRRILAAGVSGYLFKCEHLDILPTVIADLCQERVMSYFSPQALNAVAVSISQEEQKPPAASLLTPREKEILRLVVAGQDSKAIATTLGISIRTVYTHRSRILRKAKARSFYELVEHASDLG